ncbi:MAG: DEAD/DEAH box helicase [Candidatus Wildermuthbacteria bacterium]|nr:DEAD/DEAH box helicase [Candidatus Wildermuthbacteria bacterium]
MKNTDNIERIFIVSITPYFLEKGNVWFEENEKEMRDACRTQPFFQENALWLEKNASYPLSQLLRKLDEFGYEKVFHVEEPGEFSSRGGTVEVFPVNRNNAARIEFVGNTIEGIEQLDVAVEDEEKSKAVLKKRLKSQKLYSDLKGIKPGDYLVHLDHGVARFIGIENFQFSTINDQYQKGQAENKYYVLEYAGGDKLFVPLGLERKLSRYIGFSQPHVSRLSSIAWQKTKRKIKEEVEKLARQLLELYAKREVTERPAYHKEGEIHKALEHTFPFRETPDQIQVLQDIEKDFARERPMDRIVCGDVGFGKTEIALRAMVRAVENGWQAVLLAPTTILGHQHYQTFHERLNHLPVRVALLSRLQNKKEQERILQQIKNGQLDIVIGTHRILSSDVAFRNLGFLVIDDEQRFGVKQKEKLRELRADLDMLSLSATPIPRTLYMALSSLRGQVYYLHNRIGSIDRIKQYLEKLVPGISIGIAHGRLSEQQLIKIMDDFHGKKFDVLLSTTIIENGIDLPNANTLIVGDAAKLGLSQAYQLRGRVGRSSAQAYAYFLHGAKLSDKAKLRLKALKEDEELGSGYQIALRDMEIRGAGNILGKEQSGSVNAIGLNLYCQMLSEAVEKIKH